MPKERRQQTGRDMAEPARVHNDTDERRLIGQIAFETTRIGISLSS